MTLENRCIICKENANAKNSHIVPMNLIKNCVGSRNKEVSYSITIKNKKEIDKKIYIGDALKYEKDEINNEKFETINNNPYTLDNILCSKCEEKLGVIEGKIYSEIILKIREEKYKNNFLNTEIKNFDVLIPKTNKLSKVDFDIYFYSIILRVICYLEQHKKPTYSDLKTITLIADFLNNKINKLPENSDFPKSGLIVYITNEPKLFPALCHSNSFDKLLIVTCHFFIIMQNNDDKTIFGNCMNYINDSEFKFIKNSHSLDDELFSVKNILR